MSDDPEAIAAAIDDAGCILEWVRAADATWHSRLCLAGEFRGAALAGCLCSVLDELGECLSSRGCPSASWPHVLLGFDGNTFHKLCPVLVADMTGLFDMRPDGGIA